MLLRLRPRIPAVWSVAARGPAAGRNKRFIGKNGRIYEAKIVSFLFYGTKINSIHVRRHYAANGERPKRSTASNLGKIRGNNALVGGGFVREFRRLPPLPLPFLYRNIRIAWRKSIYTEGLSHSLVDRWLSSWMRNFNVAIYSNRSKFFANVPKVFFLTNFVSVAPIFAGFRAAAFRILLLHANLNETYANECTCLLKLRLFINVFPNYLPAIDLHT